MDCLPAGLDWCQIGLIDPARVDSYARSGLGPPGFSLTGLDSRAYLRSDGTMRSFVSPELDPAPWFDPLVPESADFIGIVADTPSGYDAVTAREITERLGYIGGGAFSPERKVPRVHEWSVWVIGSTVAGAQYGFRWLKSMLSAPCEACATCDMAVRLYLGETWEVGRWLQYEAALTAGPKMTADHGVMIEATFTITAANPYLYLEPVVHLEDATLQSDPGFIECVPFDVWFCGSLPTNDICLAIDRTIEGESAPILELDASGGGADGIHILLYDDCPGGSPGTDPRGVLIPKLEPGWRLAIDSARGVINAWTPTGELVSGSNLVRTLDHGDPFLKVANCDDTRCLCVGVDHPCGGGLATLVNLSVQWRTL